MSSKPVTKIIGLASVLALGFLFVVLAGAIYGNWFPIVVAIIFAVSYLPVIVTTTIQSSGFYDDLMNESTNHTKDFARFLSSFLTVSAVGIPLVLCHSHILTKAATVLTEIGGVLIFGTVVVFTSFFEDPTDEVDI